MSHSIYTPVLNSKLSNTPVINVKNPQFLILNSLLLKKNNYLYTFKRTPNHTVRSIRPAKHDEKYFGNNDATAAADQIGGDYRHDTTLLSHSGLRSYVSILLLPYGEGFRL